MNIEWGFNSVIYVDTQVNRAYCIYNFFLFVWKLPTIILPFSIVVSCVYVYYSSMYNFESKRPEKEKCRSCEGGTEIKQN